MRIFFRLLVELLVLSGLGAAALSLPACSPLDERQQAYYRVYHVWRSAFDAVSAACGAGLLTREPGEDYTPLGQTVLLVVGALGAVAWLRAFVQAWARVVPAASGPFTALIARAAGWSVWRWLAIMLLPAGGAGLILLASDQTSGTSASAAGSFLDGAAAYLSLGWSVAGREGSSSFVLGGVALLGGLGLPALILAARNAQRGMRACLRAVGGYLLVLVVAAALITLYETPRGRQGGDGRRLSDVSPARRALRALNLAASVSAAGIATEPLADRQASEGTHAVVAALLLIGPLPTAPGGGIKTTLLFAALGGLLASIGLARRARDEPHRRLRRAGAALLLWLLIATKVAALGLLLIETLTASRFTPPPGLADALLDAASAVCGGGISGGLTHAVTNEQLTHGIRLPIDLYPYGMSWLMLAMLLGRLLPVLVLLRYAGPQAERTA